MKIIDVHTHIDYITQNFQKDVVGSVCCAVQESDWEKIVNLINADKTIYGAFGIHPWFVDDVVDRFDERLKQLLKTDSNYVIGEIGLDKNKSNIKKQMDVFIKQFNVAVELKRNICMHCVGAWDKILHVLKKYQQSVLPKIIIHGFNENVHILNQLLRYENIFFSLNKNSVYGKKCRIEEIPVNRILVETDGKKDVLLKDVVTIISEKKNNENMENIIYDNTKYVLNNE